MRGYRSRRVVPIAERFWAKVNKNGPIPPHRPELGPCWLWTAATTLGGYGNIGLGRAGMGIALAHRVSWELHNGPIPEGLSVLHRCDVRRCVHPEHLFLGTTGDNNRDMYAKGRAWSQVHPEQMLRGDQHPQRLHPELVLRGEDQGSAKLTEAIVRQIRAAYAAGDVSKAALARQFGVTDVLIGKVVRRELWKHVD